MSTKQVRTRIAPSPTGSDIHIGNLYTAILNYAWAFKNKGQFIIRIEDTDKEREVKGSAKKIINTLKSYNIIANESPLNPGEYGPYTQSKRLKLYKKYALKLIETGNAYYCTCTKDRLQNLRQNQIKNKQAPKYDKHCLNKQDEVKKQIKNGEPFVIRLNVKPNKQIEFNDLLRGKITFNTKDIDDQVLIKSDGFPTYHLAVVVDDYLMKINYVIRAEEWISSTPKHILIYKALGFKLPVFAHTPLLRNSDKSKLSKRKNPVWASWYLQQGFLPQAVVNYLCLMGWSHPNEKQKFSFKEFVKYFDIKDVDTVGPIFDIVKLQWLNGQYIKDLSEKEFFNIVFNFNKDLANKDSKSLRQILLQIKPRIRQLNEIDDLISYFYKTPTNLSEITDFANKESKLSTMATKKQISKVLIVLTAIKNNDWFEENIDKQLHILMEKLQIKPRQFFMPIRVVVSGRLATPPLGFVLQTLGKREVLKRLNNYLNH